MIDCGPEADVRHRQQHYYQVSYRFGPFGRIVAGRSRRAIQNPVPSKQPAWVHVGDGKIPALIAPVEIIDQRHRVADPAHRVANTADVGGGFSRSSDDRFCRRAVDGEVEPNGDD